MPVSPNGGTGISVSMKQSPPFGGGELYLSFPPLLRKQGSSLSQVWPQWVPGTPCRIVTHVVTAAPGEGARWCV